MILESFQYKPMKIYKLMDKRKRSFVRVVIALGITGAFVSPDSITSESKILNGAGVGCGNEIYSKRSFLFNAHNIENIDRDIEQTV